MNENVTTIDELYISIVDVVDAEEMNTVVKIFKIGYLAGNK